MSGDDPMASVLDDCRYCQGTGMATLNPDEEPGSHVCVPAHTDVTEQAYALAYDVMRNHPGVWFDSLRAALDALAAAGLLAAAPTTTEWGIRWSESEPVDLTGSRDAALRVAARDGGTAVRRDVTRTAWREA